MLKHIDTYYANDTYNDTRAHGFHRIILKIKK